MATSSIPRIPSKKDDDTVASILHEFSQLQTYRAVFAGQWEEVAQLILPTSRNTFFYSAYNFPGQKKTDRQIDASGMMALNKFSAILDSLLTPKNLMWHGLESPDDYVMKDRATRLWFDQVTKLLFKYRYMPYANFTSQNHSNFLQLGAFGTHGMFIDEFDDSVHPGHVGIRYKSIPMGELFIRENHQGVVDGFIRWFRLTARQAYQKWGAMGTFPAQLQTALDGDSELLFNFLHCVRPRTDYEPGRLDAKGKPYSSHYICMESKTLLSEGGYRMIPSAISRYEQAPGEVYGRSPAMMVLPALKTLNAQKRTFLKVGHRIADPVLLVADDGVVDASLRPGAINKGGMSPDGRPLVGTLPVGNLQTTMEMMNEEKSLINDAFLVNLFQMSLELKDMPTMTATQVIEITNQKGILIAPTVGGQNDYLATMVERELDVLASQNLLPPMPPRLMEAGGEYRVVFTNPMQKAMRAQEASGFMRTLEVVKELVNITQDQSLLDPFDFDTAVPAIADIQSVPFAWMSDDDSIAKKRQGRAQALAQQQKVQAMPAEAAMMKAQAAVNKSGGGQQPPVPAAQGPAAGGPPLAEQVAQ